MAYEEINSPLPARKIDSVTAENETAVINEPTTTAETAPQTQSSFSTPLSVPTQNKTKSKTFDIKLLMTIGGGIAAIGLLVLIITKVVLPKIVPGTAGVVTLNYWGLWEDNNVIDGIIQDYETKNPGVKINYKSNSREDYRTRLQSKIEKGSDDVPDMFRIHASWLPMLRGDLAAVPSDIASQLQLDSDFYDVYKADLKQNGRYMAIPLMYDQLALFYNKDLIDAAQINIPRTWWGLSDSAAKLTVRDASGKIKVAGVAMGITGNVDHWSDIIGLMLKQNGVALGSDSPDNDKKLAAILTYYTLFNTRDHVWDDSLPSSTQAFAEGNLAFYFAPSWRIFNIQEANPKLNFEIAKVPQLPTLDNASPADVEKDISGNNITNINYASYWVEGVNPKSSHQKEAWKFLAYLASKEGLEKLFTAESQVRSFGEIYPRKSMADSISGNSKIKPFLSGADSASSGYLSSRTYDAGLNDDLSGYFATAIDQMVTKNVDATTALPALKDGIGQIINKYQLGK